MPFVGFGLHILVALYFAVHVVRSGQQMYWLIILFSFPLLGSVVYFVAIYLPNSRLEHTARKAVAGATRALDPTRELREARAAFDYTPTAQNQMRLAHALLEAGQADESATNYQACLKGPFASDPEIRFCAARAFVGSNRHGEAVKHLSDIRQDQAAFRAEAVSLLTARALAGLGRKADAQAEFESALSRFGGFEVHAEYAIWAIDNGDSATAARLQAQINQIVQRWNRHTRSLNSPTLRRLRQAQDLALKQRGSQASPTQG